MLHHSFCILPVLHSAFFQKKRNDQDYVQLWWPLIVITPVKTSDQDNLLPWPILPWNHPTVATSDRDNLQLWQLQTIMTSKHDDQWWGLMLTRDGAWCWPEIGLDVDQWWGLNFKRRWSHQISETKGSHCIIRGSHWIIRGSHQFIRGDRHSKF